MTKLYKLTDQNMQTYGRFQWELGVSSPPLPAIGDMCSGNYYHAYKGKLTAVIMNRSHANIKNPRMFIGEGDIASDDGTKVGVSSLVLLEEIRLPVITTDQIIAFAIMCAKEVYNEKFWTKWSDNWLYGNNRTAESAVAAEAAEAAEAEEAFDLLTIIESVVLDGK